MAEEKTEDTQTALDPKVEEIINRMAITLSQVHVQGKPCRLIFSIDFDEDGNIQRDAYQEAIRPRLAHG